MRGFSIRSRNAVKVTATLSAVLIIVSGCVSPRPEIVSPQDGLKGTITVSGAWALYPMMVRWAEEFQKINPGVRIDISAGGAGKGVADALGGLADIGMVSRDISPSEIEQGGFYVSVVKDAVVATASAGNPFLGEITARGIKQEDFIRIWATDDVKDWRQIFPASSTGGDTVIHVYTRSDACGAGDVWAKYLGVKQEDLHGVGIYGDPGIAEAVARDELGIGYNNIGYAYDIQTGNPVPGLVVIPIDLSGNKLVDPGEDFYGTSKEITGAISRGAYPSPPARELYLLTLKSFKGVSREFVRWILTEGQKYVEEAGYIQLPPDRLNQELAKLK